MPVGNVDSLPDALKSPFSGNLVASQSWTPVKFQGWVILVWLTIFAFQDTEARCHY